MMMNQGIPEELITDILWRLPIGGCIARFRCVCRSWRRLLSDPSFILQRDKSVDSRHQIMINLVKKKSQRSVYSLYSADTLEPLLPSPVLLPINPENPVEDNYCDEYYYCTRVIQVAGSCNGLICISDNDGGGRDLILWNPATSETKLVPPSHFRCTWARVAVGFGFDSETDDYKIVRQFEYYHDHGSWGCSYVLEAYSLRNDLWTKLEDDGNVYNRRLPYRQIPQCNKGKLYWWTSVGKEILFQSFDISRQNFQKVYLPYLCEYEYGHPECLLNEEYMVALLCPYSYCDTWVTRRRYSESWEIWVLLKFWVSESWIKLSSLMNPPPHGMTLINPMGILRNSNCLFLAHHHSLGYNDYDRDCHDSLASFLVFHPETGNLSELDAHELQRPTSAPVMINYMSSQVCMRDYCTSIST